MNIEEVNGPEDLLEKLANYLLDTIGIGMPDNFNTFMQEVFGVEHIADFIIKGADWINDNADDWTEEQKTEAIKTVYDMSKVTSISVAQIMRLTGFKLSEFEEWAISGIGFVPDNKRTKIEEALNSIGVILTKED